MLENKNFIKIISFFIQPRVSFEISKSIYPTLE